MDDAYVAALKRERAACVANGDTARVKAIDAELKRGDKAAPATETATTDTTEKATTKRGKTAE